MEASSSAFQPFLIRRWLQMVDIYFTYLQLLQSRIGRYGLSYSETKRRIHHCIATNFNCKLSAIETFSGVRVYMPIFVSQFI